MDVHEILKKGIEQAGGIGLYSPGQCGCGMDDIAPCDNPQLDCEVAFTVYECEKHGNFYGAKNSDQYCPECEDS